MQVVKFIKLFASRNPYGIVHHFSGMVLVFVDVWSVGYLVKFKTSSCKIGAARLMEWIPMIVVS